MTTSSGGDTDSTKKLDGKYDSEHNSDVDIHTEHNVDVPYGVHLDNDVDMERDSDDDKEGDTGEEDEEKEEDKEDEDEDEDDGKEPRTIGQGEMVNTSADDVDTIVDDETIMLPEQGQVMRKDTPWPQPLAPATKPQTLEPHP